ncbi:uroporphyrinogen decarboxylase family protein [Fontivita pretiosa]|uniref:uroporphyrinogen decarboxylase family protein n=1 Tax=Fontivita pretiosa TaxID=2989684 RepID=UPI003D1748CE
MTPREKFIMALEGKQPPGRVPHFELVFFLTMEALGRVHPRQRNYKQWQQMSERERELHRRDIADLYVAIARKYEHSAIFFHPPDGWPGDDDSMKTLDYIREISGDEYFLLQHGDATYAIPNGSHMMEFVERIADDPQGVKDEAQRMVDQALERGARFRRHGVLDGLALCSDYCFNSGPFLSPAMFDEFITPYLIQLVAGYREMGYYVIKHTDGNILPILDSLLAARPHALHSLDPQGGIDIADIKRRVGKKVALCGNVNCGLMDTGTDEQVIESARYALKHGMPGGGYIFSTSNCIYTGMPLRRYELILDVWRKEGNYPDSQ